MCTAAEAIIQNEVMDVIPSLWEQVCLYMMEESGNDYLSWKPEKRGM